MGTGFMDKDKSLQHQELNILSRVLMISSSGIWSAQCSWKWLYASMGKFGAHSRMSLKMNILLHKP
jgi:hypothetical protein